MRECESEKKSIVSTSERRGERGKTEDVGGGGRDDGSKSMRMLVLGLVEAGSMGGASGSGGEGFGVKSRGARTRSESQRW